MPRQKKRDDGVPTRADEMLQTGAERLIGSSIRYIEERLPPDARLTEAQTLLAKAQELVADYVESEGAPDPETWRPDVRHVSRLETRGRELIVTLDDASTLGGISEVRVAYSGKVILEATLPARTTSR